MKTTMEISEALLARAKRHSRRSGKPLRLLVEEGLQIALERDRRTARYKLPDRSVGKSGKENPLETMSWQDLREEIYGRR